MPKRKAEGPAVANGKSKKRALSDEEARSNFRKGLFDTKVLGDYQKQYAESQPYDTSSNKICIRQQSD